MNPLTDASPPIEQLPAQLGDMQNEIISLRKTNRENVALIKQLSSKCEEATGAIHQLETKCGAIIQDLKKGFSS